MRASRDETRGRRFELELIEKAFQAISKEISYEDLAKPIGVLYLDSNRDLESNREQELFTPKCVWVCRCWGRRLQFPLNSRSFLRRSMRPICGWVKGQQTGRMGSYRWNMRTLLSRGSRELYCILGLDLNLNPLPLQTLRDCVHPDLPALEQALTVGNTCCRPKRPIEELSTQVLDPPRSG